MFIQTPVILSEPINNPKSSRKLTADMFFEKFNSPGLMIMPQPVLSLFSQGKTTGVVLESGDGVTQVAPIYEGYSLPNTVERVDLGGCDITAHLRLLLKRSGYNFNTPSELEILKSMKEVIVSCKNSTVLEDDLKKKDEESPKVCYLPDGTPLTVTSEGVRAAEILFNPKIVNNESVAGGGVQHLVVNCIKRADMDLRDSLYKNIVLTGGNTLISKFLERLQRELQGIVKSSKTTVGDR